MSEARFVRWRSLALLMFVACGDEHEGAVPADGGTSSAEDAGREPDGGIVACTSLPEVVDTGMTAPEEPDIDPADFETAAVTLDFDPEGVTEDDETFGRGVQSGAMTPDGALLVAHVADGEDVTARVWRDGDALGEVVVVAEAAVTPNDAGYARAEVSGLAPATEYAYAFFTPVLADGVEPTGRSRIGRFRTAPAEGMALALRFGATTCTGSAEGTRREGSLPYPSLLAQADQELDALLHLGDMTYADNATTLEEYRAEWARTLTIDGYLESLASTGLYLTWDDHEVDDNWNPETIPTERREAAFDAFFESLPVERPDGHLWTSYRWGDTAEIFVLDLRSERMPSTLETESPVFVSPAQLAFLKEGLAASEAHFKLVLSSVNISNLPGVWDVAEDDRWEGYATQREELLDFIVDEDIDNVWFLAGDIHVGFVGRVEPEGHRWADMWEITVGPGASNENPLTGLIRGGLIEREEVYPCNQFVYANGATDVATTLALDPLADTIRVVLTDVMTDEVLFDERLQQER